MVSMPTGSGKSMLFQIAANFEREHTPGACAIVITPTVALALDHERTLSSLRGLAHLIHEGSFLRLASVA